MKKLFSNKTNNTISKKETVSKKKTIRKICSFLSTFVVCCSVCALTAFADGGTEITEPLTKLNDLMFAIFRIIGIALAGYSIYEFATSLKSHDGAQKNMAILGIVSGLIIIFIKEILQLIGVSV